MVSLYDACDQISDLCHQQLLRKVWRKISWTDGRTNRGKTVYPPPPSGSGGIIRYCMKGKNENFEEKVYLIEALSERVNRMLYRYNCNTLRWLVSTNGLSLNTADIWMRKSFIWLKQIEVFQNKKQNNILSAETIILDKTNINVHCEYFV